MRQQCSIERYLVVINHCGTLLLQQYRISQKGKPNDSATKSRCAQITSTFSSVKVERALNRFKEDREN